MCAEIIRNSVWYNFAMYFGYPIRQAHTVKRINVTVPHRAQLNSLWMAAVQCICVR